MSVAVNSPQPLAEHVFDELRGEALPACELCRRETAAYCWSEQCTNDANEDRVLVYRICAGMILLVGKASH